MSNGTIKLYDYSYFLTNGFVFTNRDKECDFQSGITSSQTTKYVGFFLQNVGYIGKLMSTYTRQVPIVIDFLNDQGGANGIIIQLLYIDTANFNNDEYMNEIDKKVLVYFGTTSNESREYIQQFLYKKKKMLFSLMPATGEQCLSNIINVGRLPHHYHPHMLIYHFIRSINCAIVASWDEYIYIYLLLLLL